MNKATGKNYAVFGFICNAENHFYFSPPLLPIPQILDVAKLMCHQCWSVSGGHGHHMSHDDTLMVTILPAPEIIIL